MYYFHDILWINQYYLQKSQHQAKMGFSWRVWSRSWGSAHPATSLSKSPSLRPPRRKLRQKQRSSLIGRGIQTPSLTGDSSVFTNQLFNNHLRTSPREHSALPELLLSADPFHSLSCHPHPSQQRYYTNSSDKVE